MTRNITKKDEKKELSTRFEKLKDNIQKQQKEAAEVAEEGLKTDDNLDELSKQDEESCLSDESENKTKEELEHQEKLEYEEQTGEEKSKDITTNTEFNILDMIKKDTKKVKASKPYYLDILVIDAVKKLAKKQKVSESKVVNDILKYLFNID